MNWLEKEEEEKKEEEKRRNNNLQNFYQSIKIAFKVFERIKTAFPKNKLEGEHYAGYTFSAKELSDGYSCYEYHSGRPILENFHSYKLIINFYSDSNKNTIKIQLERHTTTRSIRRSILLEGGVLDDSTNTYTPDKSTLFSNTISDTKFNFQTEDTWIKIFGWLVDKSSTDELRSIFT